MRQWWARIKEKNTHPGWVKKLRDADKQLSMSSMSPSKKKTYQRGDEPDPRPISLRIGKTLNENVLADDGIGECDRQTRGNAATVVAGLKR